MPNNINDTNENRLKQDTLGYRDGSANLPRGTNDELGKTSDALKGAYDRGYDAGYQKWRDANPESIIVRKPLTLADYAIPFQTNVDEIPFSIQVVALTGGSDFAAIVIRHDYEPDYVDLILGFEDCGYGLSVPISDLTGWYPVRKKDMPA